MTIYEQLERDEGGVQHGLYYVNGIPHIGIGHNLRDVPISDVAARQIFKDDLAATVQEVERLLPWMRRLSDARVGALINLAFNMGVRGLLHSNPKLLAALESGRFDDAAAELLDGPYKDQVGARAHRLAEQLRTDRWV